MSAHNLGFISSPLQSTGRAIVLTLASAFALALAFPSREQPLIRNLSNLVHGYLGGSAFIP